MVLHQSAIIMIRTKNQAPWKFILNRHTSNMEDSSRYIGVEIQSTMLWIRHLNQIQESKTHSWNYMQ